MKKLLILSFIFLMPFAHADTELEMIKDVISLYQPEIRRQYGKELHFKIEKSSMKRASMTKKGGPGEAPLLMVTSAYLELFVDDEIINTICHEIGHLLGDKSIGETFYGNAIESEADYFAGSCDVRYFQVVKRMSLKRAQEEAWRLTQSARSHVKGEWVDARAAYGVYYPGISTQHEEPACRLLSIQHGIMGWKRPICWYNPQKK